MSPATLLVPFRAVDLHDLWQLPTPDQRIELRSASDGSRPRHRTEVAAHHDGENLYVLFSGQDEVDIVASHFAHDAPLYEEDVVEVFLAVDSSDRYFEFEVSPVGTIFDALVRSPDGIRATMHVDRAWNCEGAWAATRREPSGRHVAFLTILTIPFRSLGASPRNGAEWGANFFRIDRHRDGDEFTAWQPTQRVPADFHVRSAFGRLRFEQ